MARMEGRLVGRRGTSLSPQWVGVVIPVEIGLPRIRDRKQISFCVADLDKPNIGVVVQSVLCPMSYLPQSSTR